MASGKVSLASMKSSNRASCGWGAGSAGMSRPQYAHPLAMAHSRIMRDDARLPAACQANRAANASPTMKVPMAVTIIHVAPRSATA